MHGANFAVTAQKENRTDDLCGRGGAFSEKLPLKIAFFALVYAGLTRGM
jgi:hypothetical protein